MARINLWIGAINNDQTQSARASCSLVRSIRAGGKRRIRAPHTRMNSRSRAAAGSGAVNTRASAPTVHYLSKSNFNWRASEARREREMRAAGNKNVRGVNNLTHQALTHSAKDWTQLKGSDENYFLAAKCSHKESIHSTSLFSAAARLLQLHHRQTPAETDILHWLG
jgi:hypothetical protein